MRKLLVMVCGLCWPALAAAGDPLIGQKVFLKNGAVVMAGDRVVETRLIPVPATVVEVRGERVSFGSFWTERKFVLPPEEAIAYFSERVEQDPNSAAAWTDRGNVWREQNQIEKAIADFSEALRLDPNFLAARIARGNARTDLRQFEGAIEDYSEVIRSHPRHPVAHMRRAFAYYSQGDYENAQRANADVIRILPKSPSGYNDCAWIYATCPDPQFRDGERAVKNATTACELTDWEHDALLDTLAAAYAEKGEFDSAVKWEEKAIELSPDEDSKPSYRQRLDLYKSGKPFREDPRTSKTGVKPAAD